MTELAQCIRDVQEQKTPVHIIYKSHDRWPLSVLDPPPGLRQHGTDHSTTSRKYSKLRISVLDSSFNPPTLAHLALARSKPPTSISGPVRDCDAGLLLLSVRNADKAPPKPGEATYVQRLEMMKLLAQELESEPATINTASQSRNVAVAIIDEPTFVRKSSVLRVFLESLVAKLSSESDTDESVAEVDKHQNAQVEVKLSFVMGFDTLERFIAPRYYNNSLPEMHNALRRFFSSPPEGDDSEVICSWRGQRNVGGKESEQVLQLEGPISSDQEKIRQVLSIAQPFIESGSVSFITLTDFEMSLSSTEIRARRLEGLADWRTMVPSRIGEYIEESKLYNAL